MFSESEWQFGEGRHGQEALEDLCPYLKDMWGGGASGDLGAHLNTSSFYDVCLEKTTERRSKAFWVHSSLLSPFMARAELTWH